MPHCKSCNTTLAPSERHCPACGRTASPGTSVPGFSGVTPPPLAGPSPLSDTQPPGLPEPDEEEAAMASAADAAQEAATEPPPEEPLPLDEPAPLEEPTPLEEPDPDELAAAEASDADSEEPAASDETVEEPEESTPPRPPVPEIVEDPDDDTMTQERPRSFAGLAYAGADDMPEKPAKRASRPAKSVPATGPASLFSLQPEELRARVAEKPDMLEKGLKVFKSGGKTVGAGYETEVGEIDLLAEDSSGALVVVQVAPRGTNPVGPVLERLGWVQKHVAKEGQEVRAMVLLEPPAPDLGYAAKAVADTVTFKTYRVTVALDDIVP